MGVKSIVPYSKLIIRKSQVFSTRSYMYLNSDTQIRYRGGTMCPPPGQIGLTLVIAKHAVKIIYHMYIVA